MSSNPGARYQVDIFGFVVKMYYLIIEMTVNKHEKEDGLAYLKKKQLVFRSQQCELEEGLGSGLS